jgi:hypothetical protein
VIDEMPDLIRLSFPDGRRLELGSAELWHVTGQLVAEHGHVAHAVGTAADLRLELKSLGGEGEIVLDERQAQAILAVLPSRD